MSHSRIYASLFATTGMSLFSLYNANLAQTKNWLKIKYPEIYNIFTPCSKERKIKELNFLNTMQNGDILAKVITNTFYTKKDLWDDHLQQLKNYSYRPDLRQTRLSDQDYSNFPYKYIHMKNEIVQLTEKKLTQHYTHTKKTSTTLISAKLNNRLFRNSSVALGFDVNHCFIKAMLIQNGSTYSREWVSTNKIKVEDYQKSWRSYSYTNIETFKSKITTEHNEVLANLSKEALVGIIIHESYKNFDKELVDLAEQRQKDVSTKLNKELPILIYHPSNHRINCAVKIYDEYKQRLHTLSSKINHATLQEILTDEAKNQFNSTLNQFSYFASRNDSKKILNQVKPLIEDLKNIKAIHLYDTLAEFSENCKKMDLV